MFSGRIGKTGAKFARAGDRASVSPTGVNVGHLFLASIGLNAMEKSLT